MIKLIIYIVTTYTRAGSLLNTETLYNQRSEREREIDYTHNSYSYTEHVILSSFVIFVFCEREKERDREIRKFDT